MAVQNPVIVLPGITASELLDDYPLRTETIWSMVLNKEFERIALHPDNLRYEATEPGHVYLGRAFTIYDDLIRALRHELSVQADKPTPVFAFPYDWRMDLKLTGGLLGVFIEEVLARTRLLRHYARVDDLRVDLVGHSMGGLVICEYLRQHRQSHQVGKVVSLATPFFGSIEAVVKIATGMSLLSGSQPTEREREFARATPAVYQLFPSFRGAAIDVSSNSEIVDLFDANNIQTSTVDSLAEYVRLFSVDVSDLDVRGRAQSILQSLLNNARAHREMVTSLDLKDFGMDSSDWLAIIGVGEKTRLQIGIRRLATGPRFEINDDQFVNELSTEDPRSRRTGDSTVPLLGAIPPFLSEEQTVCVMKSDFGLLELRDRALADIAGFHASLPNLNVVQRLIVRHLRPTATNDVWGRRIPGVDQWKPPIEHIVEKRY